MPRIIPYSNVLAEMTSRGFVSLYHNSGAFGFARGTPTLNRGWLGPPDGSLRPQGREVARQIHPPFPENLACGAVKFWQKSHGDLAWVMPKSHWAYELDFGSHTWMPQALSAMGIDSRELISRNTGDAIEFQSTEIELFQMFIATLLGKLHQSDFAIAWPGLAVTVTVHSHQQLWWRTTDLALMAVIDEIVPADS